MALVYEMALEILERHWLTIPMRNKKKIGFWKAGQPRIKNLKLITKFLEWENLPTVTDESSKENPLEFAVKVGEHRAKR
jgi:hypothetical protein